MVQYILKRLVAGVCSVFVLITVTFFMMHAIPGGPFSPAEDKKVPAVILERLEEKYGLKDPVHVQYMRYLKNLTKGDLGISFIHRDVTVNEIVARGFPVTAKVGAVAMVFSIVVGVPLGIVSALNKERLIDWISRAFSTIGVSVPNFVVAVLSLSFFAGYLKWIQPYGLSSWKHYILPVICISLQPVAYISRLTRSSMLEALRQDYIRTARAKGVSERMVVLKHALRNSMIPVITYLGPLTAVLLMGSFVIERLFSIPGIGREFVYGIYDRDYSVVIGLTIFYGVILVVANIIVDILYVIVDPRVKIDE